MSLWVAGDIGVGNWGPINDDVIYLVNVSWEGDALY